MPNQERSSTSAALSQGVLLVGERVLVRRPTSGDAEALADLLSRDHVLHKAAGMSGRGPSSAAEWLADTTRWARDHDAICLAIVPKQLGRAVGMISLSHIDLPARRARIGYWTASAYWGQGLTGEAFGLVLQLARSLDLKSISASIRTDNIASQRIYRRYGSTAGPEHEGRCKYILAL